MTIEEDNIHTFFLLIIYWIDWPNTIPGIQHANKKLSEVYYQIQVNFKKIKGKDYETFKAKLSWNKPQVTWLTNSSMNITNWHTSRIRFPISPNKEKDYFWEILDIFKCELLMKCFTANEYMAHTLFI